jgi:glycosyltransferase involved in cell wall biosynthesis/predicted negative regulator of RcsB-dependent stress response
MSTPNHTTEPEPQSIALCMIVKDEEATIERCLQSVRGLVSEINIVDTGSSDDTVRIAQRLGARVQTIPWNDDFSHARNISLDMARSEWILVLDADEVLAPDAIRAIQLAVTRHEVAGYILSTRNYANDSSSAHFVRNDGSFEPARHCKGWVESRKVRLFRPGPGIRFEGEIHEVVGPSIRRTGGRTEFLDVVVHHFGYLTSKNSIERKNRMMERLARAKCASHPDDHKAHYELGVICAALGKLDEAERSYRKSIALKNDFALAHYDLGVILSKTDREAEAVERYRTAVALDPHTADALSNLADSLQRLRRDTEAESAYRTLLSRHPSYPQGWNNFGALLASKGKLDEARDAFTCAIAIDPNYSDARQNLAKVERMQPGPVHETARSDQPRRRSGTISLCMIVRNEEHNLPDLLEQARAFVDEIIVVDTGSTDNTRTGATCSGATVFDFEWCDDFAAARNASLSHALGEWILILDADEALAPDDFAGIRELARDTKANGFSFETRNYSRDSSLDGWRPARDKDEMARSYPGWFPSEKVRLFRNVPSIQFEGAIHELVEPSILRAGGLIERARIPVHHYGYDGVSRKTAAYLAPAMRKTQDCPESAQAHFELGAVLHRLGRFDEACASFMKALDRAPESAECLIALGDSFRAAGRLNEAEAVYRKVVGVRPNEPSAHRGLGIVLFNRGAIEASRAAFERALELNPRDPQSLTNLGAINARAGNTSDAITCFRQALELNPDSAAARQNLEALAAASPAFPTLGLIMIVRDEEKNLREMLPELAPCFDEIVIVDTGSTDATAAVAREYTDKALSFAWSDDFSAARNFSLKNASADWVLWLDADDRADPRDMASLRRFLSEPDRAYFLRIVSSVPGAGAAEFLQLRLFPNIKGIGWEGKVHERLLPSMQRLGLDLQTIPDAAIRHAGYHDAAGLRDKSLRNARLLEAERGLRPNDPHVLQHLSQTYGLLGDIEKAIETSEALVRAYEAQPPNEYLTHTMNRLVQYHLILDNLDAAKTWADRLLTIDPGNQLACYFLGDISYRRNRFNEAIEWFGRFRNGKDDVGFVPVPWRALRGNAHNYLGLASERIGKRDRAREEFRAAIRHADRVEPHKNLARILLEDDALSEATAILRAATEISDNDADLWMNLGVALARSGAPTEAAQAFRRALEIAPDSAPARHNLDIVLKNTGSSPETEKRQAPELTLNMIVKDEERNLREGLTPIARLFDEIIIVDTGSRDATASVAEELGATVIRSPWNDSFAEARNVALKHSTGSWIFSLDADDRIEPRAVKTLRNFIARAIPCGVLSPIESKIGDNGTVVHNYTLRLFPNKPGIHWTGAVHEQISGSLRAAGIELVKCPDFKIRHTGYEPEGESLKKNLRNLKLLARELAARPEDPYVLFALTQAFLACGQIEHAGRWLRILWDLREKANGTGGDLFNMAAVMLADCAVKSGNLTDAEAWLERAVTLAPDDWLPHFLLGEKKLLEGDLDRAAQLLGRAAEIGIDPTLLPLDIGTIRRKLDGYRAKLKHAPTATTVTQA